MVVIPRVMNLSSLLGLRLGEGLEGVAARVGEGRGGAAAGRRKREAQEQGKHRE